MCGLWNIWLTIIQTRLACIFQELLPRIIEMAFSFEFFIAVFLIFKEFLGVLGKRIESFQNAFNWKKNKIKVFMFNLHRVQFFRQNALLHKKQ